MMLPVIQPPASSSGSPAQPLPAERGPVKYTCPMHPEIVRDGPGSCPICGMALEAMTVSADDDEDHELRDMTRRFWICLALSRSAGRALDGGDGTRPGSFGHSVGHRACSGFSCCWRRLSFSGADFRSSSAAGNRSSAAI